MSDLYFPANLNFMYDDDNEEWIRRIDKGLLILYRKLNSYYTWCLSYVDDDDYQYFLIESDIEEEIMNKLKIIIRDSKINELLS